MIKMLAFFSPYKYLIEAGIIGALVLGMCYGVNQFIEAKIDQGYNKAVAEYTVKLAEAKDAARLVELELRSQRDAAILKGSEREETIKMLGLATGTAASGLRSTTEAIARSVSMPNATVKSLGDSVTALSTVFTECVGRYQELATKADRHANDAQTLNNAWPKNPSK